MMIREMKRPGPEHPILLERNPRRVVVKRAGVVIADTQNALRLREALLPVVNYIPRQDVNLDLLERSQLTTDCPYKGECVYFHIPFGGSRSVNAAWSYENPYEAVSIIRDYIAFYPGRVDAIQEFPLA